MAFLKFSMTTPSDRLIMFAIGCDNMSICSLTRKVGQGSRLQDLVGLDSMILEISASVTLLKSESRGTGLLTNAIC